MRLCGWLVAGFGGCGICWLLFGFVVGISICLANHDSHVFRFFLGYLGIVVVPIVSILWVVIFNTHTHTQLGFLCCGWCFVMV